MPCPRSAERKSTVTKPSSLGLVQTRGLVLVVLITLGPSLANAAPMLVDPSVGTLDLVTPNPLEQAKINTIDGLAFDAFGNLFGVLENSGSAGAVVAIDKNTGLVTPLVTGISRADHIAFHPSGDFFVSSEVGGFSTSNRIYRVTPTYNGSNVPVSATKQSLTTSIGIRGPEGLIVNETTNAFGNAGDLFIAEDSTSGRILRVDPNSGTTTILASGLNRPEGLDFGDFGGALPGALYAAETNENRIVRIAADGTVTSFGSPGAVGLTNPDNADFGPDGFLYVSEDRGVPNSRIVRIAADGTHSVLITGFGQAQGMEFDPANGDLYIAEQDFDRVWRVRFVPEPASVMQAMIAAALLGMGGMFRRGRRR